MVSRLAARIRRFRSVVIDHMPIRHICTIATIIAIGTIGIGTTGSNS
jgi:hypothetical protein